MYVWQIVKKKTSTTLAIINFFICLNYDLIQIYVFIIQKLHFPGKSFLLFPDNNNTQNVGTLNTRRKDIKRGNIVVSSQRDNELYTMMMMIVKTLSVCGCSITLTSNSFSFFLFAGKFIRSKDFRLDFMRKIIK